jgi:twitching motility protein PilT
MIDFINRRHSGWVISIEQQVRIVHENRLALVSQREVRGTGAEAARVVRAAMRENPDVLVIEDMIVPAILETAFEAASAGQLVLLTVTAGSTTSALARIVEAFPADSRPAAQASLAEHLRGAVSQVVLRKSGGGRIAARELLLASSTVSRLIGEGQFAHLPEAMDSGRRFGMTPLNEVLVGLVTSGAVDAAEAYRKADHRAALLGRLKSEGIDTSLLERLA